MADKTKVLIVDDDALFAATLSDILNEKGCEVMAVNGGKAAIGKVKEMSFQVILMDIKMPVMNGVETFRQIKKIKPKIAVIMITAFSVETLIREALKEGAYGTFRKPLNDIEKVIEMIEAAKEAAAKEKIG